jgi:HSP20 family protein
MMYKGGYKMEILQMNQRRPRVDLKEEGDHLIAEVEVPGINPRNLHIDVSGDILRIYAELLEEEGFDKKDFYLHERVHMSFYRLLELPIDIIPELTRHHYRRGILEIIMTKKDA